MTWNYSGNPSQTELDSVRFLVGDTVEEDPLAQDEEIEFFLDEFGDNVYFAAASVAESIAARFAREVAHSADGQSFSGNQLQDHYASLAERLRSLGKRRMRAGKPYVGGISWREREQADADQDKIPTSFRSHMHDHPQTRDTFSDPLKGDW